MWFLGRPKSATENKKADAVERPEAFDRVGLLANGSPGTAELPFIKSSDYFARYRFAQMAA